MGWTVVKEIIAKNGEIHATTKENNIQLKLKQSDIDRLIAEYITIIPNINHINNKYVSDERKNRILSKLKNKLVHIVNLDKGEDKRTLWEIIEEVERMSNTKKWTIIMKGVTKTITGIRNELTNIKKELIESKKIGQSAIKQFVEIKKEEDKTTIVMSIDTQVIESEKINEIISDFETKLIEKEVCNEITESKKNE